MGAVLLDFTALLSQVNRGEALFFLLSNKKITTEISAGEASEI
jgi:hypothetical protein